MELVALPNPPTLLSADQIKDEQGENSRSRVQLSVVSMLRKMADLRNAGGLPATGRWLSDRERDPFLMHLSLLAAKELFEYAILGQYALSNSTGNPGQADRRAILLVPRKWWRRFLVDWHGESPVRVMSPFFPEMPFESLLVRARERYRRLVKARNTVGSVKPVDWFQPSFCSAFHEDPTDDSASTTTVGVLLLDSIDPRRRCNAQWFWSAKFRRKGVVFLIWDHLTSGGISEEVIQSVREGGGVVYRQSEKTAQAHPSVPAWTASPYDRVKFVIARLKALAGGLSFQDVSKPGFVWCLSRTIRLFWKSSWWYDFFERNKIGVFVEAEEGTDATSRAFAMKVRGGVVVAEQRSLEYDHNQFFAEKYADLFLYCGVHDLRQTVDLSNKRSVALTGFPSSTIALSHLASRDDLRNQFAAAEPVVTFVDEAGTIYGFSEVIAAYGAILDDLEVNGGYTLLVKSKKLLVFRSATAGRAEQVDRLMAAGKLFVFDPACPVSVPFSISDVVVTLPSTAMFEAIHLGCRTAILNPRRTIHSLFYDHGLAGAVVFEDPKDLLRELKSFFKGEAAAFGDCSSFRPEIDPYSDHDAVARAAYLIGVLRDAYRERASVQEAVQQTLTRFAAVWGDRNAGSGQELVGDFAACSAEVLTDSKVQYE